jgi:peptide/nickel transport system permease protein
MAAPVSVPVPVPPITGVDTITTVTRRRRRLSPQVVLGGGFVAAVALIALLAPLVAPYGPQAGSVGTRLLGIGKGGHLLGTDGQGRDILSRLIWGARPSLLAGLVPVLISGLIGTTLGVVAGLGRRVVQGGIMRTLDVLYAFPAVLLAIAIAAALGSGISNAIIALSVVLIPPIARVAETEVVRMRSADFMEASRASGAKWRSIAVRQVLPNIAPTMIVYCTALVGLAIVYAAGLSFLGLGIAPPHAEWGQMLNDLRQNLYDQPTLSLIPAAVIFLTSAAFNVLGDGLRDVLDVQSEAMA